MFAVSLIISIVFAPKPNIENARKRNFESQSVPRAELGSPVPFILGQVRLKAPNCIWYGDFEAVPIYEKIKTGFFSSKWIIVGYTYYLGFDLALCLGPGVDLHDIYVGKHVLAVNLLADNTTTTIEQDLGNNRGKFEGTIRFYDGDDAPSQNAYMVTQTETDYPKYPGVSHLVFEKVSLGESPQLETLNFVLSRFTDGLGIGAPSKIGDNVNAIEALYQICISQWGGLGVSSSDIDVTNWKAVANLMDDAEEEMGVALIIDNITDGAAAVGEILRQIDGIMYQDPDTSKMVLKLIRDDYVVGNIPDLNETNIVEIKSYAITTWFDTFNEVRVTYTNPADKYKNAVAKAHDMANINNQGRIRATNIALPWTTDAGVANRIAARELSQLSVPLIKATITLSRDQYALRPGDPFKLSWDEYGLVDLVMRVQRFDLGEMLDGKITIECVQDVFGANIPTFGEDADTKHVPDARSPTSVVDRSNIEAPYFFAQLAVDLPEDGEAIVWSHPTAPAVKSVAVKGMHSVSTGDGDDVVTGYDTQPYGSVADLETAYAITVAIDDGYDTVTGIRIDTIVGLVGGTGLPTFGSSDYINGLGYILINGELMSYETVTDLTGGTFRLNNIRRALLDTSFEGHAVNDKVYFLDPRFIMEGPYDDADTAYIQHLDSVGDAIQTIQDVSDNSLVLNSRAVRPLPADFVTVGSSRTPASLGAGAHTINWLERNRTDPPRAINATTDTPESSTTYDVSLVILSGPTTEDSSLGVSGTTTSLTVTNTYTNEPAEIRVVTKRSGFPNGWSTEVLPVTVHNP
jgi:hypothetical protein